MARITIEDCLEQVNNRFILVHMSNYRVRQLIKGSRPFVHSPDNREVVVSLREIADGSVFIDEGNREELIKGGFLYVDPKTATTENGVAD